MHDTQFSCKFKEDLFWARRKNEGHSYLGWGLCQTETAIYGHVIYLAYLSWRTLKQSRTSLSIWEVDEVFKGDIFYFGRQSHWPVTKTLPPASPCQPVGRRGSLSLSGRGRWAARECVSVYCGSVNSVSVYYVSVNSVSVYCVSVKCVSV